MAPEAPYSTRSEEGRGPRGESTLVRPQLTRMMANYPMVGTTTPDYINGVILVGAVRRLADSGNVTSHAMPAPGLLRCAMRCARVACACAACCGLRPWPCAQPHRASSFFYFGVSWRERLFWFLVSGANCRGPQGHVHRCCVSVCSSEKATSTSS